MTSSAASSLHLGLVAHRLHRQGPGSALIRWAQACAPALSALRVAVTVVGGAHDALAAQGLVLPRAQRLPSGREGGLMRIVSRVAGGLAPDQALDAVIFFMDPVDPSSTYPEAQALKRQCVTHGKAFVPTLAGALEWVAVELAHAGLPADLLPSSRGPGGFEEQTAALIAHDARKPQMLEFAGRHFDLLSRFAERVGTGTTGGLLNELAWSKGWPRERPWVTRYQSGPLGGDAQIAELVLDGRCQKMIFFEDPHVARQHEADIQLMERAVWSAGERTSCLNSPAMAERWAKAMA